MTGVLRRTIFGLIVVILIDCTTSLECYVCTRQEGNQEKCLTTTKTCESHENACQTELRWGREHAHIFFRNPPMFPWKQERSILYRTPYWSQGAEKQYYVTKRCARKEDCENFVSKFTPNCHRIWYEDWKCAECCQGDRCNYYIVMGSSNLKVTSWLLALLSSSLVVYSQFLRV